MFIPSLSLHAFTSLHAFCHCWTFFELAFLISTIIDLLHFVLFFFFFFFFKEKIKCVSLMVHHIAQHSKARQDEHFKFCFNFLFTFPFVIIWKSENGWYFSPLINLELKRYNKIQIAQIAYVVHHLWLIWSNENDIIYFIIIDNNHRPARCVEKIKTYKH